MPPEEKLKPFPRGDCAYYPISLNGNFPRCNSKLCRQCGPSIFKTENESWPESCGYFINNRSALEVTDNSLAHADSIEGCLGPKALKAH